MPDVLVTGSGLSAVLAALDFAEVGLSVELVVDAGDGWPDRAVSDPDGAIAEALARIAAPVAEEHAGFAGAEAVPASRFAPLLRGANGSWERQAEPEVLGVPAQPLAREVQRLLGLGGALRVWLDRLKPVLTVGKTQSFGPLVRTRIGAAALARLVDPAVVERYGVRADAVDAGIAAPGLNETLTRTGSLTGAVLAYADRNVARETEILPRSGWAAARAAAFERLSLYAVVLSEDRAVAAREGDAGWQIERASGAVTRVRGLVIDAGDRNGWSASGAIRGGSRAPLLRVVDQSETEHSEVPRSEHSRVYAEIGIQDPGVDRPALDEPECDALQLVESDGAPWAVRFTRDGIGAGEWTARLAGPVRDRSGEAHAVAAVDALDAVLARSGAERVPGAEWRIAVEAAAFPTTAARDRAESELTAWQAEESERIAVGAELFGGDIARSIVEAHRGSVALRRRLTGIAS